MAILVSCDSVSGFFSSSWGSGLKRDPEKLLPKINAGNALELANESAGDKKKAKLVAEKIQDALAKTDNPADQKVLLEAGLIAANNASDLVMVMMGNINVFKDPQVTVDRILDKIQTAGDVQTNAGLISGLLDAGKVKKPADLAGSAQDELVLSAVTLLLADAQSMGKTNPADQEDYLKDFGQKKQDSQNLTDKQKKALILAEAAAKNPGPFTDMLERLHLL
ncbi:hypothetical protein LQZ21_09880 [Treponema sp. TIM-1]|uniref:hypothetical protein n=1 Tax=Treponema sp. TIM-1 TaxID=2898417 RepID=UPI0039806815